MMLIVFFRVFIIRDPIELTCDLIMRDFEIQELYTEELAINLFI